MVLREPTDFSAESSTTHHTYEAGHQDIQAHTRFALENTPNTPLPMVHPTQLGQPESIAPNVLNSINTAPMMFYTPTQVGQYGLMAPNAPDLNNMAPIMSYAPTQAQQPEYMAPSAHNFDITSHPTFQFHVPTQVSTMYSLTSHFNVSLLTLVSEIGTDLRCAIFRLRTELCRLLDRHAPVIASQHFRRTDQDGLESPCLPAKHAHAEQQLERSQR